MEKQLSIYLIFQGQDQTVHRQLTAAAIIDMEKCRYLLTAEKSFVSLQRALGSFSAGDLENRASIGYRH